MSTIDTKFHQRLRERIKEESANLEAAMGAGQPATWEHYRELVGTVAGYRNVLTFAKEIEREIENG